MIPVWDYKIFCNLPPEIWVWPKFWLKGEVAEWSKAHAWKVCKLCEAVSRVRIPLSPQK